MSSTIAPHADAAPRALRPVRRAGESVSLEELEAAASPVAGYTVETRPAVRKASGMVGLS